MFGYYLYLTLFIGFLVPRTSPEVVDPQNVDEGLSPEHYPALSFDGFTRAEREVRMTSPVQTAFLQFLFASSPPHLFLLIYDDSYQGADVVIQSCAMLGPEYTLINIENSTTPLYDVLIFPDISAPILRRHILVLCSVENIMNIFEMVAVNNLESPFVWWLILVTEETVTMHLQGILREGSQVTVFTMKSNTHYRIVSSVVGSDNKISFQEAGSWNSQSRSPHQYDLQKRLFMNVDNDFGGRQLTVAATNDYPFMTMEEKENGELELGPGIDANVVRVLSEYLNFTYRLVIPDDGGWGGPLPNGTVTGMIGMVARREAHFAITDITITGSREEVTDFTAPYYIESMTLVSRRPREKNRAFAAFSPFSPLVWLCIAVCTLAVGLSLVPETWILNKYAETVPKNYTVSNFLFNIFRSLVQQENQLSSPYWSHKFIFVFWYLFCLNISVVYSGMLIATLVTPSFEKPIDSMTDLPEATDNGFTILVTDDTSDAHMFQEATQGIYAQTWKLFNHEDKSKSFVHTGSFGMDLVLKEKGVYIVAQLASKFIAMRKGFRRYHFARDNFAIQYYGIPCMRGAMFLSQFNKILLHINEGSLITKWINDEFQKVATNAEAEDQEGGPQAFTLTHLQAAFYILPIGYLIAALALCIEFILNWLWNSNRSEKKS